MTDYLEQGLTMDAKTRFLRVNATEITRKAIANHNIDSLSSFYLAEGIVSSLLLSSFAFPVLFPFLSSPAVLLGHFLGFSLCSLLSCFLFPVVSFLSFGFDFKVDK